jgi:hypothetical protein
MFCVLLSSSSFLSSDLLAMCQASRRALLMARKGWLCPSRRIKTHQVCTDAKAREERQTCCSPLFIDPVFAMLQPACCAGAGVFVCCLVVRRVCLLCLCCLPAAVLALLPSYSRFLSYSIHCAACLCLCGVTVPAHERVRVPVYFVCTCLYASCPSGPRALASLSANEVKQWVTELLLP